MFLNLSRQRSRHANGINPISFTDLLAYLNLNSTELHPLEVDIIFELDSIFQDAVSQQMAEQLEQSKR